MIQKRLIININQELKEMLVALARKEDCSMAEILRRGIIFQSKGRH
jgi:hypothetical protein